MSNLSEMLRALAEASDSDDSDSDGGGMGQLLGQLIAHAIKQKKKQKRAESESMTRDARLMQILLLERYMNDLEAALETDRTLAVKLAEVLSIQLTEMDSGTATAMESRVSKLKSRLTAAQRRLESRKPAREEKEKPADKYAVKDKPQIVGIRVCSATDIEKPREDPRPAIKPREDPKPAGKAAPPTEAAQATPSGSESGIRRKIKVTTVEAVPASRAPEARHVASSLPASFQHADRLFHSQKQKRSFADWITDFDDYERVKTIGRGTFGTVNLMKKKGGSEQIAVKEMKIDDSVDEVDVEESFRREVEALTKVRHRCVVPLFGFSSPTITEDMFRIGTAYMSGGTLETVILKKSGSPAWYTPTAKAAILLGIVMGMEHIHSKGIIHRDLKPANVLLNDDHLPYLADFGCCKFADLGVTQTNSIGTPRYMAPEQHDNRYTNKVDLFAFGSVMYEVLTGERVFGDCTGPFQILQRITQGRFPKVPGTVPGFARDVIERCWSIDPDARPSFQEVRHIFAENDFRLADGVDIPYLKAYYSWASGE